MTEPIYDRVWHDITSHLPRHHDPRPYHQQQTPTTTEATVTLTAIANDIKDHIAQGTEWFAQITEQHVPAILAAAARYEQSPIVQALEGVALTPEIEQEIAGIIKRFASLVPQQAAAPDQTPQDTQPAEQLAAQ